MSDTGVTPEENDEQKKRGAGGWLAALIAVIVGLLLAILAAFGIVSSQTATPAPVDQPYIVYGDTA